MTDYVFVHGGGQAGWVWAETIAALRLQQPQALGRTLALDAPGCGTKRDLPTDGLDISAVAADLIADIERVGISKAILVGHSQAGQAIPVMARLRPDLFSRIVYVTCSAPLPGQNVQQMIGKGMQGASDDEVGWPVDYASTSVDERYDVMFCNDMSSEQKSVFLSQLRKDMWPAATYGETGWRYDDLDRIPATFILCLRDQALPLAWQERFALRLGATRHVRIDAGHQVMNSRPYALAEVILHEAGL